MAEFVVRYFFDKEHYIDETIQAQDQEEAWRSVRDRIGPVRGQVRVDSDFVVVDTKDGQYLVPKGNVRCCRIRLVEADRQARRVTS